MKERPIIFSTDLIPKILDRTKIQTRRIIKPCSTATLHDGSQPDWVFTLAKCPYGQVGDRLWVRETYLITSDSNEVLYKADNNLTRHEGVWRSPLFMPRRASRITLEITKIRVERLQEITEEDAIKEGCQLIATKIRHFELKPKAHFTEPERPFTYRDHFIGLWDSLNEKRGYPWESNPFVWMIEFMELPKE